VGSVLFQTGDIRIIKADTLTTFVAAANDSICYIGRLEFNISTAPYAQRRFTFYSIITQGLVIDGDTLFSNNTPPPVYNGNGFTCNYANNVFTITGAFDVVHIFGSTNCVYGMCLSPDTVTTSTCLNITTGTQTYLNDIRFNNILYPVGSVLFQTGDIRIIKADTLTTFMSASNDSICYIGRLEFNISTAPYAQRRFTFYSIITQGLVIDGDTLFSNNTPPPVYNGNGFTCTYANNIFTITGAFDVVHIFGSTNCISGVCLEALPTATSDMMDDTSSILLYPNPAHDVAVLHADGITFERVWIWNLQGILVYQENANGGHHTLELSTLPNGFYIWQVMDTNGALHSGRLRIQ